MTLRQEVIARLASDVGVSALVGDRIFSEPPKAGTAKPYIVVTRPAVQPAQRTAAGQSDPVETTLQLGCWDRDGAAAETVAAAVRAALVPINAPTLFGAVTVLNLRWVMETDSFDEDTREPGVLVDFIIRHREG